MRALTRDGTPEHVTPSRGGSRRRGYRGPSAPTPLIARLGPLIADSPPLRISPDTIARNVGFDDVSTAAPGRDSTKRDQLAMTSISVTPATGARD